MHEDLPLLTPIISQVVLKPRDLLESSEQLWKFAPLRIW